MSNKKQRSDKQRNNAAIEQQRREAWALHCRGVKQTQIAALLGVTQGAVSRWLARVRSGGIEALRVGRPTGLPPRLSREKQQMLPALLAQSPEQYGLAGTRWTRALVRDLIHQQFGVVYSMENVSYILRKVGWNDRPLLKQRNVMPRSEPVHTAYDVAPRSQKDALPSLL